MVTLFMSQCAADKSVAYLDEIMYFIHIAKLSPIFRNFGALTVV